MRISHWVVLLPVLAGPVFAQVTAPNCTEPGWDWVGATLLSSFRFSLIPSLIPSRLGAIWSGDLGKYRPSENWEKDHPVRYPHPPLRYG